MKFTAKVLGLVALSALVLISCSNGGGAEVGQAEEFVPGTKRWAGPMERIADPSVVPVNDLGRPDVTITVEASTSEFEPDVIRVKQNQVVKLILKGTDDGDMPKITGLTTFSGHGFLVLGPYDIWVTGLRSNVTREITFVATEAGEFDFECTVFCSVDHYKMRGVFIVEPTDT